MKKIQQLNALAQDMHYPVLFLADTALGRRCSKSGEKERDYSKHANLKCVAAALVSSTDFRANRFIMLCTHMVLRHGKSAPCTIM